MPIAPGHIVAPGMAQVDFTRPLTPATLDPAAWDVGLSGAPQTVVTATAVGTTVELSYTPDAPGPQSAFVSYSATTHDLLGADGQVIQDFVVGLV